jgi:hypothetical protein
MPLVGNRSAWEGEIEGAVEACAPTGFGSRSTGPAPTLVPGGPRPSDCPTLYHLRKSDGLPIPS